jgi:hypothetical protein
MRAKEHALWRRLDVPGHDAARLMPTNEGWRLCGTSVFKHQNGPTSLTYSVIVDAQWRTIRGRVRGFVGDSLVEHSIDRDVDGWRLDGVLVPGLGRLLDLDYAFTPATNLLQIRRVAPDVGASVELPVAWFDVDAGVLTELPQRYERQSESTYRYTAPSVPYEGLLELSPNGFALTYPGLWQMET